MTATLIQTPPPGDNTQGDETVLLSSAHVGTNTVTIDDSTHMDLPENAQDEVLELLGLDEVVEQFEAPQPSRMMGVVIMSPLDATITGPGGQVLSKDQNDFGTEWAEYDDDPTDPDDPKVITLADPPVGTYDVTYTGTGPGEYTIITTYADANETVSATQEGTTQLGKVKTETIAVGTTTTSLIDDTDYRALLEKITDKAYEAQNSGLLKGFERANITRLVIHAQNDFRQYEQRLAQQRISAARERLRSYHSNLNELKQVATQLGRRADRADFANELLQLVEKIQLHSPSL